MSDTGEQSVQKVVHNLSDNARLIIGAIEYCDGRASSREITSITGLGQKDLYYYMNSDNSLENKGIVDIERGSEEAGTRTSPNIWNFTEFGRRVASQGGSADERELFDVIDVSSEAGDLLQEDFEQMKEDFEQMNSQVRSLLALVNSGDIDGDLDELEGSLGSSDEDIELLEEELSELEEKIASVESKLSRMQTSLQEYDSRIGAVESSVEDIEEFMSELDTYVEEWTDWAESTFSKRSN